MKKYLLLLLMIIGICLLASACDSFDEASTTEATTTNIDSTSAEENITTTVESTVTAAENTDTESTTTNEETSAESTAAESTTANEESSAEASGTDEIVLPDIDIDTAHFFSIEAYNNFISTTDALSDSFVYYDSIQALGAFDSLVFCSLTGSGDYSWYLYGFIDATGQEISLYVDEAPDDALPAPTFEFDPSTTDLRTIDSQNLNEFAQIGEMTYTYVYGKLSTISWVSNGISFDLRVGGRSSFWFSDYEVTAETAVSRFLDYRTADGAIDMIFN
ncbi:MAG: hypothetical protein E7589_08275 [Ruminococcaceae bacterium]|nr:hypothetical protein [Oscillospiraceae bacterium]